MRTALPPVFRCRLVGMTFAPGYPENVASLELRLYKGKTIDLDLERDPGNKHDPNAVRVMDDDGHPLGHVPAFLAERLAPALDGGEEWACQVTEVVVHPDNPRNPGLEVSLRRL